MIINVSDDEVMAPDHTGRFDRITQTAFGGRVDSYGIYFLELGRCAVFFEKRPNETKDA